MNLTVSVSQFRQHVADYITKAKDGNTIIVKDEKKGQKTAPRDIYGIYNFEGDYPQLDQKLDPRFKALILTSKDGISLFAR